MPNTPLNDDEYDDLDDLLAALGPQSMDVSKLEGFLTAIVIGPRQPPQEQWLPLIWGADAAGQTDAAAGLVLRHYHYMVEWMAKDPGSFEPIYECGGTWTADAWCEGFLAGMQQDAESWAPLRASQPALLAPFQRDAANRAAKIAPAVIQIHAFWHKPQPKAAKVGRNDPCPCGSGKKYKKCCDAAG
ncbi:MAG: UPF0149 family protein [Pseudomonadota bacterium]